VLSDVTYKKNKVFYRTLGAGKPVMLVHGFGEDGGIWSKQADVLSSSCRLIIPDLAGSGRSVMNDTSWSIDDHADSLAAILNKESIPSCTMVGHSMGGYITLAFAEKYPGGVNAFGLFHSTAFADSEEKKATRRKGIAFIQEHGAAEFLKTATPNLFAPLTREKRAELVEKHMKALPNFMADVLVSYYYAMIERPDRTAVLKTVKTPVLFIMGEFDTAIPVSDVLKQCYLPGKSYIHILKKSGHMGMLEETEKSNRVLKEFLL
jgi:pimeloyl-ACP methyl ester carboxylesterase